MRLLPHLLVCLGILYNYNTLNSQPKSPDELAEIIKSSSGDSIKGAAYYDLARISSSEDIETAYNYLDSGLIHFERFGYLPKIKEAIYIKAILKHTEGLLKESLDYAEEYYQYTLETKNIDRQSYALSILTKTCRESGDLAKAVSYATAGLIINDSLGYLRDVGYNATELGNLYSNMKQHDLAKTYFLKSYEVAKELDFQIGEAISLRNLAESNMETYNFDSAKKYVLQAMTLDSINNYTIGLSRNHKVLAHHYEQLEEFPLAIKHYNKALNYLDKTGSFKNDIAFIHLGLARIFLVTKDLERANFHLLKSNKSGEFIGSLDYDSEYEKVKFDVLAKKGNYKEAYFSTQKYIEKRDSLLNEEISNQITGNNIRYESEQKEKEIQLLNAENENASLKLSIAQRRNILFSLGLLFLAGIIITLFSFYKKIKEQNGIISKSLKDKDFLLREIHHRVKNNLQVISSLLSLQSRFTNDPHVENAIQEGRDRVKSMSLIHQYLYQKENLSGVNIKQYLSKLFNNLFYSYNISPEKVKLELDIEELNIDVDTVVPIGLIVNELITNSLKYAFPDMQKGTVSVSLKEANDELILMVADDGIGLKDDNVLDEQNTFGFKLISAFKSKLDADISISSESGTSVTLVIRNYKLAA